MFLFLTGKEACTCLFHFCFSNLLEAPDTVREHYGLKGLKETKVKISISNRGYYTLYVVYLNWKSLKDILKQKDFTLNEYCITTVYFLLSIILYYFSFVAAFCSSLFCPVEVSTRRSIHGLDMFTQQL